MDEIDDEFAKLRRIKSSGPRGFVPKNKKGGKNKKNKKNKNGKGKGKGKKQRDWSALGGTSKKKLSARDIADINLSATDIWDIGNKNDENVDEEEQRRLAENRQVDLESSDEEESDYVPDFDVEYFYLFIYIYLYLFSFHFYYVYFLFCFLFFAFLFC